MSNRALKAGFAAVILVAAARIAPAIADPTGLWVDKDGWTIRIQACGPDLCAVIASVKPPLVLFRRRTVLAAPWSGTEREQEARSTEQSAMVNVAAFETFANA